MKCIINTGGSAAFAHDKSRRYPCFLAFYGLFCSYAAAGYGLCPVLKILSACITLQTIPFNGKAALDNVFGNPAFCIPSTNSGSPKCEPKKPSRTHC